MLGWFSCSIPRSSIRWRNHQLRSSVVVTFGVTVALDNASAMISFASPTTSRKRSIISALTVSYQRTPSVHESTVREA